MMMVPRKRNEFSLLDDIFDDAFFGKADVKLMRTDIRELENTYVIDIDLPGYEKEDIKIEIEKGYLTVNVSTLTANDVVEDSGKYIRRERFQGECSRSFYVGDNVKETDVKASFKNGILKLEVPKENQRVKEEKKYIPIE